MGSDVVGLVALDFVLGIVGRGAMGVALVVEVRGVDFDDSAADVPGFSEFQPTWSPTVKRFGAGVALLVHLAGMIKSSCSGQAYRDPQSCACSGGGGSAR